MKHSELLILTVLLAASTCCSARDHQPQHNEFDMDNSRHSFNQSYAGRHLDRVAFPLGGIGAGMICLEGTGCLSHVSIRNQPEVYNEPYVYAALAVKGDPVIARVLEGPLPRWKLFGQPGTGNGAHGKTYGLPRLDRASFLARFPFAEINLHDRTLPLDVTITGWSPFTPPEPDDSSLPVGALEYTFTNNTPQTIEAVYSFHAHNFLAADEHARVHAFDGGFIFHQSPVNDDPAREVRFCAFVDEPDTHVNLSWFRGVWFDPITVAWNDVERAACYSQRPVDCPGGSPGATIYVPLTLAPDEQKTVALKFCWYNGRTGLRFGNDPQPADEQKTDPPTKTAGTSACGSTSACTDNPASSTNPDTYKPWYAARFADIEQLADYWRDNYQRLRQRSAAFRDCFYDTTMPPEVIEAVAANLTILKSPTILRQRDGRLWCWEGCCDGTGCCHGSCTHVWNYAQALPHLFPCLERTLRETEFFVSQNNQGHQTFRTNLPIRPVTHDFHAASDGQLGGIMKVHREWRISGDTAWLKKIWPRVKDSLDYCIRTWDPDHQGVLTKPHHNTYDIEFWGPDGMCSSFYLGALQAAIEMGRALDDPNHLYDDLLTHGVHYMNDNLFDGEYYFQNIQWDELRDRLHDSDYLGTLGYSPEAVELLKNEGPKYQYGRGCLSDGILGQWIANVCSLDNFLPDDHIRSHLLSVYKYNLRHDLSDHANTQRPSFAAGNEGGLLLCSWPKGGKLELPFVYSNEVWTGIEYQVASHLMLNGCVEQGLDIVRTCRKRYDGTIRNPFNEYECGHWYGRALASYGLLQGLTGARYDAVDQILTIQPNITGDFRSFIATATGFGTLGVQDGKPFLDVVQGQIPLQNMNYIPYTQE